MKALLLSLALLLSINTFSQTFKVDASGNLVQVTTKDTTKHKLSKYKPITLKGVEYPVYVGSRGGLYIIRKKRGGGTRKQYIKIEAS